jgi:uncharacterized cupin superfamily protein
MGGTTMTTETLKISKKNLGSPDVTKECGRGTLEFASLDNCILTRVTLEPGWKWSEDVGSLAKTEYCEVEHVQYVISGRLMVVMEDGTEMELVPGDFAILAPGHDAWVLGNEPFVGIDFSPAMKEYAEKKREGE